MGLFQLNLTRTDIIPIVNYAWDRSFARVRTNLKAIRDRGWGPLNQILLSHPEIINGCKNELVTSSESSQDLPNSPNRNIISNDGIVAVTPSPESAPIYEGKDLPIDLKDLNLTDGFAGETLCSILRKLQRDR